MFFWLVSFSWIHTFCNFPFFSFLKLIYFLKRSYFDERRNSPKIKLVLFTTNCLSLVIRCRSGGSTILVTMLVCVLWCCWRFGWVRDRKQVDLQVPANVVTYLWKENTWFRKQTLFIWYTHSLTIEVQVGSSPEQSEPEQPNFRKYTIEILV